MGTLNGRANMSNMTTFTNCPTIYKHTFNGGGTKASICLGFGSDSVVLRAANNERWYFEINGVRFGGTRDINDVNENTVYLTTSRYVRLYKLAEAIRSNPEIGSRYDVSMVLDTSGSGQPEDEIRLTAKQVGSQYNITFDCYDNAIVSSSKINGSAVNDFSDKAMFYLDVYGEPESSVKVGGTASGNDVAVYGKYLCTLEKRISGNDIYFDLSSVFSTYAEYGKVARYTIKAYYIDGDDSVDLDTVTNVFAMPGYMVNQGGTFFDNFSGVKLLQNNGRGGEIEATVDNRSMLYIYEPRIMFTVMASNTASTLPVTIYYKDGLDNNKKTETKTIYLPSIINDITIDLDEAALRESDHLHIAVGSANTLRYSIIKPIKAAAECQRVYFRNSWNGISFFDFTGARTEERDVDTETYEKSYFSFYENNRKEHSLVYDKTVKITVTLTSQYIDKNGIYLLYDMQKSRDAWTVVNSVAYRIIVEDLEIDKGNMDDVYVCQIKYRYSMEDTF